MTTASVDVELILLTYIVAQAHVEQRCATELDIKMIEKMTGEKFYYPYPIADEPEERTPETLKDQAYDIINADLEAGRNPGRWVPEGYSLNFHKSTMTESQKLEALRESALRKLSSEEIFALGIAHFDPFTSKLTLKEGLFPQAWPKTVVKVG